jgi:arylsulfatase A-like enzyme
VPSDQQRFDTSSLHGNPMNLTPNFDRMARKGTHIAEAVTCQPVCGPARSAFQTGLWPTTSGCFRNNIGLPDDSPKIAELFADAGYNTAVSIFSQSLLPRLTEGPLASMTYNCVASSVW